MPRKNAGEPTTGAGFTERGSAGTGFAGRGSAGRVSRMISLAGLLLSAGVAVWGYRSEIFASSRALQDFVGRFGALGPLLFVILQIVQVVFPILPGGVSCLAGVLLFGPLPGFVYNYVGICIGSLAAFGIARALGKPALLRMFPEKLLEKYESWTTKDGRFLKFFAAAIFFPVAPDDFLCYLAGTTSMTWKQFSAVIILGKPCSIALYSVGLAAAFRMLFPAW